MVFAKLMKSEYICNNVKINFTILYVMVSRHYKKEGSLYNKNC